MKVVWFAVAAIVTAWVTRAEANPGELAERCTRGVEHARGGDLPRAMLYLAGCDEAALPGELSAAATRAVRDTRKALRASELSELSIVTTPAGLVVELDALPGEKLTAPVTVWVKAGTHTVRTAAGGRQVVATITTQPYSRALLPLDATPPTTAPMTAGRADFTEENATESQSGPPPDIKRPSLMSNRYRGIAGPRFGPELRDPLAVRVERHARPWFGLRLGGGMYDDASTDASLRPSVAAAARFTLHPRLFLAARLDWSRRGGAATSAIDSTGLSLGAGTTVAGTRALALAVIGQLRGDLRFADARDMVPVRRAGLAAAASIELAFRSTPLTAGLRLEQGVTELVAGTRDRAVLVELGVDWR